MFMNKKNMAGAIFLLGLLLVTHSRIFDILINNYLGRLLLIALIIAISYTNKILGVVAVLFMVVAFNNMEYRYNFMEGFDASGNNLSEEDIDQIASKVEENIQEKQDKKANMDASLNEMETSEKINVIRERSSQRTTGGMEGFNMIGMENEMKRGKNSNTIPIDPHVRETDNVAPSTGSSFGSNFAAV